MTVEPVGRTMAPRASFLVDGGEVRESRTLLFARQLCPVSEPYTVVVLPDCAAVQRHRQHSELGQTVKTRDHPFTFKRPLFARHRNDRFPILLRLGEPIRVHQTVLTEQMSSRGSGRTIRRAVEGQLT